MLYTLTINPAIDMNVMTTSMQPKLVNRYSDVHYSPNGKGLNVSFVLAHFQIESKILGFFGGFTGNWIREESKKRNIEVLPILIDEPTRINLFLNDGVQEYKLVHSGAEVKRRPQEQMLTLIESLENMTYLTINGSLPPGVSEDYYEELVALCLKKKVNVILDISSIKLKQLLKYKPLLIKPNDEEIEAIFDIVMRDEADIVDVLKYLAEKGAQNILLTLGEKGAYFYNQKKIYYIGVKEVAVVSSACSGDAFLGAFLSVWLDKPNEIERALKLAAATGANVAESYGLGEFESVSRYVVDIQVRVVEQ